MRTSPCVTAFLCLSAALAAQNVTVPATLAGVEGGGGTSIPFGSNLACRYQCIYDAVELPWSGPRVITGISLRADHNGIAILQKGFLDISVLMSTTSRDSASVSGVFADNYGPDATWVLRNQLIMLPAQPIPAPSPRPANIDFMFQVPWAFGLTPATGSQPAPANLLVEIHIHAQPAGVYRIDNLSGCTAPSVPFGMVQPACQFSPQGPVLVTGDDSMLAGSPYQWRVERCPPSMPFLLAINLSNTGFLFGNPAWPLPYPMFDPANPSQPSPALAALQWPAPGCWLNIQPVVTLGGQADASGIGVVSGLLPAGRQFVGTTFHSQAIVLAPTVNPLRFISSGGNSNTICGPLGVARVHAFYNNTLLPPPPPPTSGQVQLGVGMVFEVR